MTEPETLERAKMYIEKLANSIDPLDGSQIPDEDIVNNVRISRCLIYVTDVLRRGIENGGVSQQKRKKERKIPFSRPMEKRDVFAFSSEPISVSEISRRINALIADESMMKLPYRAIRDWLIELGMLEEVLGSGGERTKRPTLRGKELGIALESWMSPKRDIFCRGIRSGCPAFYHR